MSIITGSKTAMFLFVFYAKATAFNNDDDAYMYVCKRRGRGSVNEGRKKCFVPDEFR